MKILGLNGKPLEASGKVFLPPAAGSSVDVRMNQVNDLMFRYGDGELKLDLSSLVTGNKFICLLLANNVELGELTFTINYNDTDDTDVNNFFTILGIAGDGTTSESLMASITGDMVVGNVVNMSEYFYVESNIFPEASIVISWD